MLVRVLIVIVVVAVLGFFGTRGSEKVVEEVTERQATVDALQQKVADLAAQLEEEKARHTRDHQDSEVAARRTTEELAQLKGRVSALEEQEAARVEAASAARVRVMISIGALVVIDGVRVDESDKTPRPLALGDHVVIAMLNNSPPQQFTLVVKGPGAATLDFTGKTPRAIGPLTLKRVS